MNELKVLFLVGPFSVTAYGLCLALGTILAALLTLAVAHTRLKAADSLSLCLTVIPCALLGARAVYCLTMLDSILVDYGASFIPQLWQGGYTLYGAVLFGALGGWLYARVTKRRAGDALDVLAPGAALALMVERLAEYFTSQGLGDYVEDEARQRFPYAVQSAYGDWQAPVFLYEALAALLILIVVLLMSRKARGGRVAETFVILLGMTQVLLESWREDDFIRFGFVRFNQLAAVATVGAVLAARVIRRVRSGGFAAWQGARIAVYLAGVGACIGVEFALDKSAVDNNLLYAGMAVALAAMTTAVLYDGKKRGRDCNAGAKMVQ